MTEWADVEGWPGYRVSRYGCVSGPRRAKLAGYRDKNGYCCVGLYAGGQRPSNVKVHRLVAAAFIGPIPEGMQVNHINGVKHDNRVENLEIVTLADNIRHSFNVLGRKGRNVRPVFGSGHHHASLTEDEVAMIRHLYAKGARQVDLAMCFRTPQTNISRIVRGEAWRHVAMQPPCKP